MIDIGRFNSLEIIETRSNGLLLDAGRALTLLLPIDQVSRGYQTGERIDVFIYLTADGQPAATTTSPLAEVGQVAWLEIVDVTEVGAFAHWGLPRDLFIPFAEQQYPLRKGKHVLLWIYLDNQGRIAGSTRVDHWITDSATGVEVGQEVALVIADQTELGLKAVVNHHSWGLLYGNELFRKLSKGQRVTGYIKRIRADNKIDLSLETPGFSKGRIEIVENQIMQQLEASNGQMALTDKSPPETIYATFGVSKKVFKQALGALYKQRRITLNADGVTLVKT
jgi:predicted RNA-binding protein (virulence factor B family)